MFVCETNKPDGTCVCRLFLCFMALGLAEGASILQANHRSHVTLARPQCHKSRMEVRDFVGHQEFKVIFQHVKCRVCVETHGKSLPVYDTFELGTGPVPI